MQVKVTSSALKGLSLLGIFVALAHGQIGSGGGINLGSFQLNKNAHSGDLEIGIGQGGSLFGYGADRALQLQLGQGKFGARTDSGLVLGGDRLGVDSHLGLQEGQALGLGSDLRVGPMGYGGGGGQRPPGAVGPLNGLLGQGLGGLNSLLSGLGSLLGGGQRVGTSPLSTGRRPSPIGQPGIPRRSVGSRDDEDYYHPLSKGDGWERRGGGEEGPGITTTPAFPTLINPNTNVVGVRPGAITTEGRRRWSSRPTTPEETASVAVKETPSRGKNDGETNVDRGEEKAGSIAKKRSRMLPVPEGLEEISYGKTDEKEIPLDA